MDKNFDKNREKIDSHFRIMKESFLQNSVDGITPQCLFEIG